MKLLFENWRKYLNESSESHRDWQWLATLRKELGSSQEDVDPEAINLFHEWLVYDVKDKVIIDWIQAHKERIKYMGPRRRYRDPHLRRHIDQPIEVDEPDYTHCDINLTFGEPGVGEQRERWVAFKTIYEKTRIHVEQIKKKFPYDVFQDIENCALKLEHLDELAKAFVYCPYLRPEGDKKTIQEHVELDQPTPYELCAQDLRAQHGAEEEIRQITDPFEREKEENETNT